MNLPVSARPLSRRRFLSEAALGAGVLTLCPPGFGAESSATRRFPIIAFSKPFQKLDAGQTADFVAEIGWDGIECPVRARGQIEPERSPDELPKFAEALRRLNRDIHIVTTDITTMAQPHAETVLRTVARLGIQRIRLGTWNYRPDQPPTDRLKEIAPALRDIAAACGSLGIQAGFQNHSGSRYVGAPIWDVFSMIRDLDPKHMGMCFDIGHATLEGGLSWPIEARLIEPFYTAIFVKDFYWKKTDTGWKDTWCPLGEGMVSRTFFDQLKRTAYRGPISQHHEYPLGDRSQMLTHMKHDLQVLKSWLA